MIENSLKIIGVGHRGGGGRLEEECALKNVQCNGFADPHILFMVL